jgi:hypothetical protein
VPLLVKALSKVPFGANEVIKLLVRIVREVLNDHAHIQSHGKWTRLEFWIDKKNLLSENSKLFGTWCTVFGDWRQRHPHTHLQLLHGRRWELPGDHSDWLRRVAMDGERNVKRKTATAVR